MEKLRQFGCCLACIGISPCSERNEYFFFVIECHITVHHGTDTYSSKCFEFYTVLFFYIRTEIGITVLQTIPYSIDAIGPKTVYWLVFPLVTALGDRLILLVYQYGFDSCRTKFDTEDGFTRFYCLFCVHHKS